MVHDQDGNVLTHNLALLKINFKSKKMKFIYSIILGIASLVTLSAQVAIGKSSLTVLPSTSTPNPSISLEFGSGFKGLILPWVTNAGVVSQHPTANQKGGALVFDRADRKVKFSKNNGTWVDLTVHSNELPVTGGNFTVDAALQTDTSYPEKTEARSQIGGSLSDVTPGILVLADINKAMIPPLVENPEINIKSPAPGMMVFDPIRKLFCVYNGTVWSYWRAG